MPVHHQRSVTEQGERSSNKQQCRLFRLVESTGVSITPSKAGVARHEGSPQLSVAIFDLHSSAIPVSVQLA